MIGQVSAHTVQGLTLCWSVFQVSVAARMWGRAQLLVLLTALSAYGDDVQDDQLKVGRAIDIFTRYGYFSLSMKVVPRNDTTNWIFREPTIDIFNGLDAYTLHPERVPKKQRRIFDGDFHMEFCDNIKQLLQAYFRDFNFEKLDKPWRAFSGSWGPETIARNLGINSSFVYKDHCYVLVRLSRFRDSVQLTRIPNNINLVDVVAREIDNIRVGNVTSVLMFIRKYGSHYIDSYVTGNSLYQVIFCEICSIDLSLYHNMKRVISTTFFNHFSN